MDFGAEIGRIEGDVEKLNQEVTALSSQLGTLAQKEAKTAENKVKK